MQLTESLFEGRQDAEMRVRAATVFERFANEITNYPGIARATGDRVIVSRGKSRYLPKDLKVVFSFRTPEEVRSGAYSQFMPSRGQPGGVIEIAVSDGRDLGSADPLERLLPHLGSPEMRSAFVHEFVHYLDWRRIGSERWSDIAGRERKRTTEMSPEQQAGRYYTDPIEQNAYFQMVADQISGEFDAEDIVEMGPGVLYGVFHDRLERAGHSPDLYRDQRHLQKRVYQFWAGLAASKEAR